MIICPNFKVTKTTINFHELIIVAFQGYIAGDTQFLSITVFYIHQQENILFFLKK